MTTAHGVSRSPTLKRRRYANACGVHSDAKQCAIASHTASGPRTVRTLSWIPANARPALSSPTALERTATGWLCSPWSRRNRATAARVAVGSPRPVTWPRVVFSRSCTRGVARSSPPTSRTTARQAAISGVSTSARYTDASSTPPAGTSNPYRDSRLRFQPLPPTADAPA